MICRPFQATACATRVWRALVTADTTVDSRCSHNPDKLGAGPAAAKGSSGACRSSTSWISTFNRRRNSRSQSHDRARTAISKPEGSWATGEEWSVTAIKAESASKWISGAVPNSLQAVSQRAGYVRALAIFNKTGPNSHSDHDRKASRRQTKAREKVTS